MTNTDTSTTPADASSFPQNPYPADGTLSAFRDDFQDWLNRPDCATLQANRIINRGIGRLNRDLRIPTMEKSITLTASSGAQDRFPLPDDFLDFKDVVADGTTCMPTSYGLLMRLTANPGRGSHFARDEGAIVFRPAAKSFIRLVYYAAFPRVTNDTDTSPVFTVCNEALMFACLSAGGDMFAIPQQQMWEASYQREMTALNMMAQKLDSLGGPQAVQPVSGNTPA